MESNKPIVFPINKKLWVEISKRTDNSGIKIIKHENLDGNILEKLVCVVSLKDTNSLQLTMTHFHRQAKTVISKNPKKKHSDDFEETNNVLCLKCDNANIYTELSVGTEEAEIVIFLETDNILYNIAHVEFDLDDNPGEFNFFASGKIIYSDAPHNNKRIWRKD